MITNKLIFIIIIVCAIILWNLLNRKNENKLEVYLQGTFIGLAIYPLLRIIYIFISSIIYKVNFVEFLKNIEFFRMALFYYILVIALFILLVVEGDSKKEVKEQ